MNHGGCWTWTTDDMVHPEAPWPGEHTRERGCARCAETALAVAEEREACAKVAENIKHGMCGPDCATDNCGNERCITCRDVAAAIRARSAHVHEFSIRKGGFEAGPAWPIGEPEYRVCACGLSETYVTSRKNL